MDRPADEEAKLGLDGELTGIRLAESEVEVLLLLLLDEVSVDELKVVMPLLDVEELRVKLPTADVDVEELCWDEVVSVLAVDDVLSPADEDEDIVRLLEILAAPDGRVGSPLTVPLFAFLIISEI